MTTPPALPTRPARSPSVTGSRRLTHVDGLRALAVSAVVLYHCGVPGVPNGFLGVDVFFVISGYVISRSLASDNADRRSVLGPWLVGFYSRRVWRIAPALLVMIVVTGTLFALFEPSGDASATVLWTGAGAVVGAANLVLLGSTQRNYFDTSSHFNPFLHTWSLGVEEQFYLVFPLLFWLVVSGVRSRRVMGTRLLIGLSLASVVLSAVLWAAGRGDFSFYLLPTRFWELSAGALAFLAHDAVRGRPGLLRRRIGLAWTGATVILASFAGLGGSSSPFPAAVLPVAGTVLLIWFGGMDGHEASRWSVTRWLSAVPVQWLGRISYSLYLWHWPVIVVWIWVVGPLDAPGALVLIAASLGCAALSYYCVERPVLRSNSAHRPLRRTQWIPGVGAVSLAVLMIGVCGWGHDRFVRASPVSLSVTRATGWSNVSLPDQRGPAPAVAHPEHRLIVLGDSHTEAYQAMARAAAARSGLGVLIVGRSTCGFSLLTAVAESSTCAPVWDAIDGAERGDLVVFIALRVPRVANLGEVQPAYVINAPANMTARAQALTQFESIVRHLDRRGVRVVINSPEPLFARSLYMCADPWFAANSACRLPSTMPRSQELQRAAPAARNIVALAAAYPSVIVWDVFDALCPKQQQVCSAHDKEGRELFVDGDHVSGWGNEAALPSFERALRRAGF